jgi:phosphatidylethanolamine/phosphatidyl-N-methylethanolamine N-methyltransferase
MGFLSKLSDTPVLLEQWLHAPRCIGAVAPSSKGLARAMARWSNAHPADLVLELGPGTGAVTEALLEHGVTQERLLAIETTPALVALLRERFPHAGIVEGDARQLARLVRPHLRNGHRIGAVVSSLPLRHFTEADRASISDQIHQLLPPTGRWIQFTYHLGNGHPPGDAPFRTIHSNVVWLNVPPARVMVYEK